jgi:hypothetical protein
MPHSLFLSLQRLPTIKCITTTLAGPFSAFLSREVTWQYIILLPQFLTTAFVYLLKGRDHSEDLSVDGRIILEWIQGNRVGIGTNAGVL